MATKRERLNTLYKKFGLETEDTFKHAHYTILTRSGIEKVQRGCEIKISYEVVVCEPEFACVKATGIMGNAIVETFGSAKRGKVPTTKGDGSTSSWYVMEICEKEHYQDVYLNLQVCMNLVIWEKMSLRTLKHLPEVNKLVRKLND